MLRTVERAWAGVLAVAYGIVGLALLPPNESSNHQWWPVVFLLAAVLAVMVVIRPGNDRLRIAMVCVGSLATLSRVGLLVFAAPQVPTDSRIIGATIWATFTVVVVMNAGAFVVVEDD